MANSLTVIDEQLRRGRPGELSTYTKKWLVTSNGGADATDVFTCSDDTGLPRPKYTRLGTSGYKRTFVCVAVDVDPLKARPYAWHVTATYTSRYSPDACFAKITRSGLERIMDRWRAGSLVDGDFTWPPSLAGTEEADGDCLDIYGVPKRTKVGQQQIVIEVMYDATELYDTTGSASPDYQTIHDTYRGKRNDAAFMGWDAGKVVFQGCDESGVDDVYRTIAYRFLADDMFHVEQRVVLEPNQRPLIAEPVTWPDTTEILCASKVRWYQPYEDTADFTDMFSACELAAIQNPVPEWPT